MGGKALGGKRIDREDAEEMFNRISNDILLGESPMAGHLTLCGSYRRGKESCGDMDIVVCPDNESALKQFDRWAIHHLGYQKSGKPARKALIDGVQVEFYVAAPDNYGTFKQMWTGSMKHNIKLRRLSKSKGFSMSQYGFRNRETGELVTCATEEEVYAFLDIDFVDPKDR